MDHDYPGNVRELENIIEQAFVLCRGGLIDGNHLPPELRPSADSTGETLGPMSLQAMEKRLIMETLRRYSGNRKQASRELGIDVSSLYRKIKALQLRCRKGTAAAEKDKTFRGHPCAGPEQTSDQVLFGSHVIASEAKQSPGSASGSLLASGGITSSLHSSQ